MAITPEQVLERIRNNQQEKDAVFENVYKLPNGDYFNPLAPVAAGQQPQVLSRQDALRVYEHSLALPPEAGRTMTDCQAYVVQRWRPQYCERRQDRKLGFASKIAVGLGLAAAIWGTCAMSNIKGNENFVKDRYQQYQKVDRSVKLEDVAREAQQETERGRNVYVVGGILAALAGIGGLAYQKLRKP